MNCRKWFSVERIINNDDFSFTRPITKLYHIRLVFTQTRSFTGKTDIKVQNFHVKVTFYVLRVECFSVIVFLCLSVAVKKTTTRWITDKAIYFSLFIRTAQFITCKRVKQRENKVLVQTSKFSLTSFICSCVREEIHNFSLTRSLV